MEHVLAFWYYIKTSMTSSDEYLKKDDSNENTKEEDQESEIKKTIMTRQKQMVVLSVYDDDKYEGFNLLQENAVCFIQDKPTIPK